jgi:hypothetical protein
VASPERATIAGAVPAPTAEPPDAVLAPGAVAMDVPVGRPRRSRVFVSYSHRDARWLEEVRTHLDPVVRRGGIDLWDDRRLRPGDRWAEEIAQAIDRADAAVLLVSHNFLASPFITEHELPRLLAGAQQRGCRIISVIVEPCLFEVYTEISRYQSINPPHRPLSALSGAEAGAYLVDLARALLPRPDEALSQ